MDIRLSNKRRYTRSVESPAYSGETTKLFVLQEEAKTLPFGDVWAEFCIRNGVPADTAWFSEVQKYEAEVLSKRV